MRFEGDTARHLNVALLGMGLTTEVKAGENRGRKLTHDFVVLKLFKADGDNRWTITLPETPNAGQTQTAIAVWVTPRNSMKILQAAGGYLQ